MYILGWLMSENGPVMRIWNWGTYCCWIELHHLGNVCGKL